MNKRKLAAIMFTDIQGYTAIMQQNEERALALRDKHRKVFNEVTSKHRGEILMYYGDGTLSIFDSAVDAVQCGIEIQRAMQTGVEVPLRIGIHSGDIIITEDDVIGDGVNVASRIESLSVVGSVLISGKVHDEVKNNPAIETRFLKTFRLKNINQPTDVYAITNDGMVVPDPASMTGKLEPEKIPFLSLRNRMLFPSILGLVLIVLLGYWMGSANGGGAVIPQKKKVAVVPLAYDTPSDADDVIYFQTGMTDGLISALSQISGLFVINQSSTRVLTAGAGVGSELISNVTADIDYFVKGFVEKEDNQLVVGVALTRALNGDTVWFNNYIRDISRVHELWKEVSIDLAGQMGVISRDEANFRLGIRPVKPETYDLYLKGIHFMNKSTPEDWVKGLTYMEETVDNNPSDPYAYAALAEAYVRLGHGPAPPPDVFPKALAAAKRAIQLDSTCAEGWAALAHYHTYFGMDWELAEYAFKVADELNPNMAYNHYHRAWYLALFGRMDEAIEEHILAQELDPFIPLHTAWLGELYRWVGEYEKGLAEVEKSNQMLDINALGLLIKGWIFIDQGKIEEGIATLREASNINPGWRYIGLGPSLARVGQREEAMQIAAELEAMPPTAFGALCLGTLYAQIGDYDKAIEWLQYEHRHGWYPWIRVLFLPDEFRQDERFLKLIRGMNLPDPAPLEYQGRKIET